MRKVKLLSTLLALSNTTRLSGKSFTAGFNKYNPHQGDQERARRLDPNSAAGKAAKQANAMHARWSIGKQWERA